MFGYIRSTKLSVPPLVRNTCLLYYVEREHFTVHGQHIQLNEDKDTATCTANDEGCVYGNVTVNKEHGPSVHKCIFEIIQNNLGYTTI